MKREKKEEEIIIISDDEKEKKPTKKRKLEICSADHYLYPVKVQPFVQSRPRGVQKNVKLSIENGFITMTPVNVLNPSSVLAVIAKRDYIREQVKFFSVDDPPRWDDGRKNKAQIGEYFFFVHNQLASGRDLAEAFRIIDKKSPEHRPSHWTIAEHGTRQVLVLSAYLGYCSATELLYAVGYRDSLTEGKNCLRGTVRSKIVRNLTIWVEN